MFIGGAPIVWAGPVDNWLKALDRITALEPEHVVPGHGRLTDLSGVMVGAFAWMTAVLVEGIYSAWAVRSTVATHRLGIGQLGIRGGRMAVVGRRDGAADGPGGFLTPASAFGGAIIDRLTARAGLTFEVET